MEPNLGTSPPGTSPEPHGWQILGTPNTQQLVQMNPFYDAGGAAVLGTCEVLAVLCCVLGLLVLDLVNNKLLLQEHQVRPL